MKPDPWGNVFVKALAVLAVLEVAFIATVIFVMVKAAMSLW